MSTIDSRLAELGIQIPALAAPAAAYLPSIRLAAYAIGITGAYWLVERICA